MSLKRARELRQTRSNSQADLDAALAKQKGAEARVRNTLAAIEKKTVRAPFSGRLGIRQVDLGQFLGSGEPIVSVQSFEPIYVDFWNTVVNSMQLAEGGASGEIGGDSDNDGIPFIPEQPDGLAPVFAAEAVQNLGSTSVEDNQESGATPTAFQLEQNYPNPFNPTTEIHFSLPDDSRVTLEVYNTLGSKVATLINGQMTAGSHSVTFDAAQLPSGIYFYKMNVNNFSSIKKMNLLK